MPTIQQSYPLGDFNDDDRAMIVSPSGRSAIVPQSLRRLDGDALDFFAWLQQKSVQADVLEREIEASIPSARQHGLSWSAIGAALGVTGEGARQRYGDVGKKR